MSERDRHSGRGGALISMLGGALCIVTLAIGSTTQAETLLPPQDVRVHDTPNDGGGSLTVRWAPAGYDGPEVLYEVWLEDAAQKNTTDVGVGARTLVASFPSDTRYVRDLRLPWWTRSSSPDFHQYEIKASAEAALVDGHLYAIAVAAVRGSERAETRLGPVVSQPNWVNWKQLNNFALMVLFGLGLFGCIHAARRAQGQNRDIFLRRIPGLDAVDEAIGRATELGKPILFLTGAQDMGAPSTLAAAVILGRVSKRVAMYETDLIVPHRNPIVMAVCQEITKQAYLEAGKPDAYKEDSNFFITEDQFSYTAAVDGIMLRQKPAANFFMGYYYAESLLLTETGASTGAIQIAGTDADHQLPFFVTTCDYTLIGEELYAASAYLSREPVQVGTLRAQDLGKAVILAVLVLGAGLASMGVWLDAQWPAYLLDLFRDVK